MHRKWFAFFHFRLSFFFQFHLWFMFKHPIWFRILWNLSIKRTKKKRKNVKCLGTNKQKKKRNANVKMNLTRKKISNNSVHDYDSNFFRFSFCFYVVYQTQWLKWLKYIQSIDPLMCAHNRNHNAPVLSVWLNSIESLERFASYLLPMIARFLFTLVFDSKSTESWTRLQLHNRYFAHHNTWRLRLRMDLAPFLVKILFESICIVENIDL